ncbi:hypothetical protein CCH79_00011047 [Gambusia affinis]|uniref:Protein Dr1 n=4 Tax=Poeciliinae TaxID=586240 RepID=A0A315UW10_GAMAF|nr:hypothetical protein CCH79_00011047 [Gambusia affinis]
MASSSGNDDDLTIPRAAINKMIKETLPNVRVANDARELVVNCCTEFIHLISSEANEICNKSDKKTISPEHVINALESLGFASYITEVKDVLQECKTVALKRRKASSRLENLGIPEEELLRQQQELFAKARQQQAELAQQEWLQMQQAAQQAQMAAASASVAQQASSSQDEDDEDDMFYGLDALILFGSFSIGRSYQQGAVLYAPDSVQPSPQLSSSGQRLKTRLRPPSVCFSPTQLNNVQDGLTERRAAVPTASCQSVILFSPQQAALMFTANNKREGCLERDTLRPSYVGGAVGQQDYSGSVLWQSGATSLDWPVGVEVDSSMLPWLPLVQTLAWFNSPTRPPPSVCPSTQIPCSASGELLLASLLGCVASWLLGCYLLCKPGRNRKLLAGLPELMWLILTPWLASTASGTALILPVAFRSHMFAVFTVIYVCMWDSYCLQTMHDAFHFTLKGSTRESLLCVSTTLRINRNALLIFVMKTQHASLRRNRKCPLSRLLGFDSIQSIQLADVPCPSSGFSFATCLQGRNSSRADPLRSLPFRESLVPVKQTLRSGSSGRKTEQLAGCHPGQR